MRRKRILSQKRPAAVGEARERASFLSESFRIKELIDVQKSVLQQEFIFTPAAGFFPENTENRNKTGIRKPPLPQSGHPHQ